jgi:hypothetical protein
VRAMSLGSREGRKADLEPFLILNPFHLSQCGGIAIRENRGVRAWQCGLALEAFCWVQGQGHY